MQTGLLWFDDNPNATLEDKVQRAAAHYECKYGQRPNLCFVHPAALDDGTTIASIRVQPRRSVPPNHFWLGVYDAN